MSILQVMLKNYIIFYQTLLNAFVVSIAGAVST